MKRAPPPRGLQIRCGNPALHDVGVAPGVDWQGADQGGRAVLAARGKLVLGTPGRPGPTQADFNGRTPTPVAAPEWAQRPLSTKKR